MLDYAPLATALASRDRADIACPICGPDRHAPANRRRRVLRLWRGPGCVSFHCARCGEKGFTRENERRPVDRETMRRFRIESVERDRGEIESQREKALALWRRRLPISATPAELYLRHGRGIPGSLPPTLGYLPPTGEHPPTLIAAFAIPEEPEPGELAAPDERAIRGVHLTRLTADGGKAEGAATKVTLGRGSSGTPIVLAPMNDALGLVITEGIEDALSAHCATGCGAWAAGCASRLPALAETAPAYADCVTIAAHPDPAGRKGALALARALRRRGIETIIEGLEP